MAETLRIGEVSGAHRNLIYQARSHINADMFFVAIPIFRATFTANPRLIIVRYFEDVFVVYFVIFLFNQSISLLRRVIEKFIDDDFFMGRPALLHSLF